MRGLSQAEVRVIWILLADIHRDDADGARLAHVPRTTFQSIRRRAILSGWIRERYIPHPASLGYPFITFRIIQPYAERWPDALQALKTPYTVLLWASPETIFSVEYSRKIVPYPSNSIKSQFGRQDLMLSLEASPKTIPVYFDFEGVWSRWAMGENPIAYPRTFHDWPTRTQLGRGTRQTARRAAILDLVSRPLEHGIFPPIRLTFSRHRLPRPLQRLIEDGTVSRRLIPDFGELPSINGNHITQVLFVTGLLLEGQSSGALLNGLMEYARVTPFLYASDGVRVILASLSQSRSTARIGRTSPMVVVTKHLREVTVIRERVATILPALDHLYNRPPLLNYGGGT
jgi:hypothetical protein